MFPDLFNGQGLQTPRPAAERGNPETPKVHLKVRRMPFSTPRKNGPNSQLKCPKMSPETGFLDILIDFWGHFSGGSKWHFSDFEMHSSFGVSGFRRSVAGRGVCKAGLRSVNSPASILLKNFVGVLRGNTIRGNRTASL